MVEDEGKYHGFVVGQTLSRPGALRVKCEDDAQRHQQSAVRAVLAERERTPISQLRQALAAIKENVDTRVRVCPPASMSTWPLGPKNAHGWRDAIVAIYRTITSDRQVLDYGLHGVLRVLLCGINGTRDLVVQLTGKAPATVARTMLQPVLDEARLAARTCTRASLNNDKANIKGKVRMECAAALHVMRNRGWEKIIDACPQQPSVRQHQVGGKSRASVCKTRWENFASMCVYAWRSAWFSGGDLGLLQNHSIAMGAAHNEL